MKPGKEMRILSSSGDAQSLINSQPLRGRGRMMGQCLLSAELFGGKV